MSRTKQIIAETNITLGVKMYPVKLVLTKYTEGQTAVIGVDARNDMLMFKLSVNLPRWGYLLHNSRQFFAKGWSENREITKQLREREFFKGTGIWVPAGHADAEIWEIVKKI